MVQRARLFRFVLLTLFGALVLFVAEDVRGATVLTGDPPALHAYQEGGSPQHHGEAPRGPLHAHASPGDHFAHSHTLTFPHGNTCAIAADSIPTCLNSHSSPIISLRAYEIEHPPRS